jgi:hypothetical protein
MAARTVLLTIDAGLPERLGIRSTTAFRRVSYFAQISISPKCESVWQNHLP